MALKHLGFVDLGVLVEVDADTGEILRTDTLAGVPDVVFFNAQLSHLYVAVGDPGVIEVFAARSLVCAFLPATHRAAVYLDHP